MIECKTNQEIIAPEFLNSGAFFCIRLVVCKFGFDPEKIAFGNAPCTTSIGESAMKRTFLPFFVISLSFLVVLGCAVPEEENPLTLGYVGGGNRSEDNEDPGPVNDPMFNPMAIVEYQHPDFSDPEVIQKYARAKVVIIVPSYAWGPNVDPGIVNSMKAVNPEIKVLGYINAHSTWVRWGDYNSETSPYETAWHQATKPYWSYTTTGDTMMSWPGKVLLNILEEDCRIAMIDVIAEQWANGTNVLDGVFWDHFNRSLWVPSHVDGREGELDMDGDGVPHEDDDDEMQAYRDAATALVQRFNNVIGPDVIQITNGNLAARDSVFAGLIDGMMYENFPEVGYSGDEMRNALNPDVYNNLFTANHWPRSSNGGPYLILTNKKMFNLVTEDGGYESWHRADFNRVVALLTDNYVTYHPETEEHHYGWPEIDLDLGRPLSGVTIDGELITRDFENGRITLDFDTRSSTAPFNFFIEENGEVVQEYILSR